MNPDSKNSELLPPPDGAAGIGPRARRGGAPRRNRRVPSLQSRLGRFSFAVRRGLPSVGVVGAYALLFAWLLSAPTLEISDFAAALAVPDSPRWQPPDSDHLLGTTGTGADLLDLSRAVLARSAALSAACAGLAAALALLAFLALHGLPRTVMWLARVSRALAWMPLAVLAVVGAASGNLPFLFGAVIVCLALVVFGDLESRYGKDRLRSDFVAACCLGVPQGRIAFRHMPGRLFPWVAGTVAALVPRLMLLEMALSFTGLLGSAPSLGTIIAHGRDTMIEAPWIAVYPGIFGAVTVAAFAILGSVAASRDFRGKFWL